MTNKELTTKLMETDPHCYYCGVSVKMYPEIRDSGIFVKGQRPDDFATIEHLYDSFDPRRYKVYENNEDKVLSCYKCNHERGIQRVNELKELHRERSRLGALRPKDVPRSLFYSSYRNFEGGASL